MHKLLIVAGLLLVLSLSAKAKGLSPYLPLNISSEVESKIEKLMAITPGVPINKPYKASDVLTRVKQVEQSHPLLFKQLSSYLERFTQDYALTHFSASVSYANDNTGALPNQRNEKIDSSYQVSQGVIGYLSPYAYISAGARYSDAQGITHTNTHLALGYEYAQLDIGYREHWFSPFQDSAMLVSTHAEASPSLTISNATPISDWNIRYEVFYSILEPVDEIVLGDETFPGSPRHAGIHVSFTPLEFWTLGFNRTLQFGGGEREVDFADVIEAILDPAGKDNVGDVDTDDPNFEFGNQQASITSKFNLNWGMPISLYIEYAGEDTVSESNFQLGNDAWSYGIYLPFVTDELALRFEYSDISTGWYIHHLYPAGYVNDGQVMGHWAGGERILGRDTFTKAYSLNANWQLASNQLLDISLRAVDNNDQTGFDYEQAYTAQVTYSYATQHGFWGLDLFVGKDVFGEDINRVSAFFRW